MQWRIPEGWPGLQQPCRRVCKDNALGAALAKGAETNQAEIADMSSKQSYGAS